MIGAYSSSLSGPLNTSGNSSVDLISLNARSSTLRFTVSMKAWDSIEAILQCLQLKYTTASVGGSCCRNVKLFNDIM